MRRFKKILVVYDTNVGAEDALNQAMTLAKANDATLTVVDLIEEGRYSFNSVKERERRLQRLLPAIRADSVDDVHAQVVVGMPFLGIIKLVLKNGHDLVIAGAEGGSVIKSVFFGSTITHLIRKCPCPVWIVKPGQSVPYGRILAAIDPKLHDPVGDGLNVKIMDLATSLARMTNGGLDIVHVWDVVGNDRDTLASEVMAQTRENTLAKHEDMHRDIVGSLLHRYSLNDIDHELLLPRGLPQQEIVKLVETRDVDLIIMGTVSKTGIPGLLIGNAAETILEAVQCGVLAVKPEGFVTPIALH